MPIWTAAQLSSCLYDHARSICPKNQRHVYLYVSKTVIRGTYVRLVILVFSFLIVIRFGIWIY